MGPEITSWGIRHEIRAPCRVLVPNNPWLTLTVYFEVMVIYRCSAGCIAHLREGLVPLRVVVGVVPGPDMQGHAWDLPAL